MAKTLNQGLADVKDFAKGALPAEAFEVFDRDAVREVDRSGFAKPGSRLDDFTLPDATGQDVTLAELTAEGPAVLVFYRGGWCPYCNLTLRTYQQALLPELTARGVRLAAISPQRPDGSLSTKDADGLEFAVLSDVGNTIARRLGITFEVAADVRATMSGIGTDLAEVNGAWELAYPSVFVVDRDRTVTFADVHPDYTTRTEPAAILDALKP